MEITSSIVRGIRSFAAVGLLFASLSSVACAGSVEEDVAQDSAELTIDRTFTTSVVYAEPSLPQGRNEFRLRCNASGGTYDGTQGTCDCGSSSRCDGVMVSHGYTHN